MSSDPTPAPVSTLSDNSSASVSDAAATAIAPPPAMAEPESASENVAGSTETSVASSPAAFAALPATEVPAAEEPAERPKFRLNPTVDPEQDKAVPATSVTAQEAEKLLTEEAGAAQTSDPLFAKPGQRVEPIEIPNKRDVSLDDEMEKEIAAAMASGELPNAVVDPASATSSPVELTASNGIPTTEEELEPGTRLKGTVQSVSGEDVILDVGFRSSACVQTKQFDGKLPEVGAKLNVVVDKYAVAEGLILCSLSKATRTVSGWDEVQVDQIVDCMVSKTNKGGLEVTISSLRGFLPAGQVDFGFVSNLESYVGQKLRVKITEVNPGKKNLVVSRRAFLEIERHEKRDEMWKIIAVGQTYSGTVKTIKDYGAF
ncbi:MAG: binding domain protein, partial [Planctomycetaceae bacterium]|nr:binding domain protein [Planctomycetaceae bacterium]